MSVSKWLFYAKNRERAEQVNIEHSLSQCSRTVPCSCDFIVTATPVDASRKEITIYRTDKQTKRTNAQMYEEIADWLEREYMLYPGGIYDRSRATDKDYIMAHLGRAMEVVTPPFTYSHIPSSMEKPTLAAGVVRSVLMADYQDMLRVLPCTSLMDMFKHVWMPTPEFPNSLFEPEVPSLHWLAARKWGEYGRIFGSLEGRPYVRTALAGLHDDHKYANIILQASHRDTRIVTPLQSHALEYVDEALDRLHRALGTTEKIGTIPAEIRLPSFEAIPVHSSNGLYPSEVRVVRREGHVTYTVSARGQKCENYAQVMEKLLEHMDEKKPFAVYWAISPKASVEVSFEDQDTDEKFKEWCAKHRIFIIPSSIFIYAERIILHLRKLIESNTDIKIGFKWPRGGADFLFKGFDLSQSIFADGDFSKLDQTIHQVFMRLFYSTSMIYNCAGPDEEVMKWLMSQLVSHVTVRVTHLYDGLWARVFGQMPSGAWGTSHGDSWIVLLVYYLFVAVTLAGIEDEQILTRIEWEFVMRMIGMIVYGDDHIMITTRFSENYLGERKFAEWVSSVWGMTIRKINTHLPLISTTRNGELVTRGVVFLKHYLVANFLNIPNPPKMLPFRPKSEMGVKAVWGSSGTNRTEIDCLLTTIGLAYGQMGTNPAAHLWLENFYHSLLTFIPGGLENAAIQRASYSLNWGKLCTYDLTREMLLRGFPSLPYLQGRNSKDPVYHTSSRNVTTWDEPLSDEMDPIN